MNFKEFYEEVSKESGYDTELIRVVWNNFWKSIRESTEDNVIIDIDGFGLFHIDANRLNKYIKNAINPKESLVKLHSLMLKNKRLTKYIKHGEDDGSIS